MFKSTKNNKVIALTLFTSILLLAILSPNIISVKAQGQAAVNVLDAVGGTSDPAPGTYSYSDGTAVTFTATPDPPFLTTAFLFVNWVISSSAGVNTITTDNPATITVSGGVTYDVQPTYQLITAAPGGNLPPNMAAAAIVVVLAAAGGTTNPVPGTYALGNVSTFDLTAIPNSGWQFAHWVISGPNLSHGGYPYTATPTDNPYNVKHGYGNTFSYQAVFIPIGTGPTATPTATATPTGTIGGLTMDSAIIIGLVVVIIVILIAFGVYASRRRK